MLYKFLKSRPPCNTHIFLEHFLLNVCNKNKLKNFNRYKGLENILNYTISNIIYTFILYSCYMCKNKKQPLATEKIYLQLSS